MASEQLDGAALVTGGGRGIGAGIARELAAAGMRVAVAGRTAEQVRAVAKEIGGTALVGDVSRREDVERWVREAGEVDLLVANAGVVEYEREAWRMDPDAWWHVFEVNVFGVYLSCRAVIPAMIERGRGRIVIIGSGASYASGITNAAYAPSKAAVGRFGEVLAGSWIHAASRSSSLARDSCARNSPRGTSPRPHCGRRQTTRRGSFARLHQAASTRSAAGISTLNRTHPSSLNSGSTRSSPMT